MALCLGTEVTFSESINLASRTEGPAPVYVFELPDLIQIVTSSLESYSILFLTYDGKRNCYISDSVEHTRFFHKVACARYDVLS
jgi:hypothetical protein